MLIQIYRNKSSDAKGIFYTTISIYIGLYTIESVPEPTITKRRGQGF